MKIRPFGVAAVAALVLALGTGARAGMIFETFLSGANEAPPNASPGTGYSRLTIDTVAHTMRIEASFSGLIGLTSAAHVHAATALPGAGTVGVATELPSFTGFPLGVTSGSYDHTFDTSLTSTWSPTFMANNGGTPAGAESAFLAALIAGKAYLNIHTRFVTSGEIRGFFRPVPEPSSLALVGLGVLGVAVARRRLGR